MNPVIELPAAELKTALAGLGKVVNKRSPLPVLGHLRITRNKEGRVTLQGTDLDTTVLYHAEPASPGQACDFLVPFEPLQQLAKGGKEPVQLIREAKDKIRLKTHCGTSPMDQTLDTLPVREFPPTPVVDGQPVALDATFRDTLRQALDCCQAGGQRDWSQHVCLDTRPAEGHYLVATDGGHFYCANSFAFDLQHPVLIPDLPFLRWNQFMADGTGELSVKTPGQDDGPWVQFKSGRWTCIARSCATEFPSWKHVVASPGQERTCIELDPAAVATLLAGVPRLPAGNEFRRPVTLEVLRGALIIKARAKDAQDWTSLVLNSAQATGPAVSVTLNRDYVLKALRFGLCTVEIKDERTPVQFQAGGRRMVVSPIVPAEPAPASSPVTPATPARSNTSPQETPASAPPSAPPEQTSTATPKPTMPPTPTPPARGPRPVAPVNGEAKSAQVEVLTHLDGVKAKLRDVMTDLNATVTLLKAAEKEQKVSAKEVESVRATLRSLQRIQV